MSSSTSDINQLNTATQVVNFVLLMISFVPGSIGVVFNLLVFSRPALRRQACSVYFYAATIPNLYIVFVMIPIRIGSGSFGVDPANLNNIICKIEIFMLYVMRSLFSWLIVLACVDRYVNSSANELWRRRFSSPKTAICATMTTSVIIFLVYIHMPILFNIAAVNQFGQAVPQCVAQVGAYRTFINLWLAVIYSIIPTFLMFLFGTLTLINIRRQRRRVGPMIAGNLSSQQRRDNQLLRMLTVQVLVIVITTIPYPIYLAYLSVTSGIVKSLGQSTVERLFNVITNGFTYMAHASSFYLYTLTGTIFRKEVIKILSHCIHFDLQRQEQGGRITNRNYLRGMAARTLSQ